MVWMPVAEAAATLGVSERTIWRRIKSRTIDSRSEGGRTLVGLDPDSGDDESVRQLTNVAAAQLSMRKLDADNLCDVLTVLSEYRTSMHEQLRRSRRAARLSLTLACVLLVALFAGGWYHMNTIAALVASHRDANQALRSELGKDIRAQAVRAASATAMAEARDRELDDLRSINQDGARRLDAVEEWRARMQADADRQLATFTETTAAHRTMIDQRDADISGLRSQVVALRSEIQRNERAYATVQHQTDRVVEALRRSAARSRGIAEGLRINAQLAAGNPAFSGRRSPVASAADGNAVKQALLNSLLSGREGQVATDASGASSGAWPLATLLRTCFELWLHPAEPASPDLVCAD